MSSNKFIGSKGDDHYRGDDFATWIEGRGGDDDLGGGGGDDWVDGGNGNDLLEGGAGSDTLIGGKGIDAVNYQGATGEVHVDLAQGYAREFAGNTFTTDTLSGIEVVIGSRFDDSFIGSTGDDDLRGGAGNDFLSGGDGSDILRGDEGSDVMDGGDGFDYADYFYTDGAIVNLTTPTTTSIGGGTDDLRNIEGVYGSRGDDIVYGSAVANHLLGEAGDDLLYGYAGNDDLAGQDGKDRLIGGAGADVLYGGASRDRFMFANGDTGITADTADRIADFSHDQRDRIDLRGIDADTTARHNQAFTFVGDAAFSGAAGELRYAVIDGDTIVQADTNGDGVADGMIVLTGEHALVASDFVL